MTTPVPASWRQDVYLRNVRTSREAAWATHDCYDVINEPHFRTG